MKIERDAPVLLAEREVGRVTHVVVAPQTKEVTDIVVAHDGRESLVPIAAVTSAPGGAVRLRDASGAALRGDFVRDQFHGVDQRTADAEKARVATRGGAPLRAADDDSVVIGHVAATPTAPVVDDRAKRSMAAPDRLTVPVVEEQLAVGKRAVELGEIELTKSITEERVSVPVALRRETVTVQEREVAERPLRAGETAFQEGTIRVPVRGEEAVVAKEAVVTGEVVIDKEQVAEERTITDTVRKEHVAVERTPSREMPTSR